MSIDTNAHDIRASLGVAIPWNRVPWSSNNKKSTRQILRVQVEQTVFPVNKAVLLKGDVVPRLDHFSVRVIDISPPIFATLNLVFRIRAFLPIYSLKFSVVVPLVLRLTLVSTFGYVARCRTRIYVHVVVHVSSPYWGKVR